LVLVRHFGFEPQFRWVAKGDWKVLEGLWILAFARMTGWAQPFDSLRETWFFPDPSLQ